MSLTVRIVWQYILSRVRVSVRPSIFLYAKNTQNLGNRAASASVYFNGQRPAIVASGTGHHGWLAQTHRIAIRRRRCVCVGGVCIRPCVRDVFAIYDNNIWPRLIMIIIKNIIQYFIQIRHTDDFPSTGTRLVTVNITFYDLFLALFICMCFFLYIFYISLPLAFHCF